MCTTWNIALRKLYNLPYRCHTRYLKHVTGLDHISFTLKRRFIKFFITAQNSANNKVQFLTRICRTNLSPSGLNISRICNEYSITPTFDIFRNTAQELDAGNIKLSTLNDVEMSACTSLKELIDCLYHFSDCILTRNEILSIVEYLACN